jgi:uncharacterized protein (DUF1501 family)
MMKRRSFIKNSTMGLGVVSSLSLDKMSLSAFQPSGYTNENDNILVVVQLFGGNDGMNTLPPYEWDVYYTQFRPTLHVPRSASTVISQKNGMAMHPSLKKGVKGGMLGLFNDGKLGILSGIGYKNPDFSHFRSTDIWLSGIVPSNTSQPLPTGWLGRYFDTYAGEKKPESPFCIQVGKTPSLMFLGETGEKSIVLESAEDMFYQGQLVEGNKLNLDANESEFYQHEFNYVNNVGIEVSEYSKVIKKAFDAGKNTEEYTNASLSQQLKLVARLIDGGLKTKVFFVEHNGYDTHANQGVLDGTHGKLLAELSEAISSFQSDIEKLGHDKKVVGITASEFGRRPHENGSAGTDHGTSSVMFSFGSNVKGEIIGEYFGYYPLFDGFNHSYVTDFRSIYFEILTQWFDKSVDFAATVLGEKLNYINETGFLKSTKKDPDLPPLPEVPQIIFDDKTGQPIVTEPVVLEMDQFSLYPNPTTEFWTYLRMQLHYSARVTIIQVAADGREVAKLHEGEFRRGRHDVLLPLKGGPGTYVIRIRVGKVTYGVKCIKL